MTLPLIDLFSTPYVDRFKGSCVESPYQAAIYAANNISAPQGLSFHIEHAMARYPSWLSYMPEITPEAIAEYQGDSSHCDLNAVSEAINSNGCTIAAGQYLFHGGKWPVGSIRGAMFETIRPLSTTLCPNIATGVPLYHGRAYHNNGLDLFVLRVREPRIRAFFFNNQDSDTGHEKELVFARGLRLTLVSCEEIRMIPVSDYFIGGLSFDTKDVPLRVLEVDIS